MELSFTIILVNFLINLYEFIKGYSFRLLKIQKRKKKKKSERNEGKDNHRLMIIATSDRNISEMMRKTESEIVIQKQQVITTDFHLVLCRDQL